MKKIIALGAAAFVAFAALDAEAVTGSSWNQGRGKAQGKFKERGPRRNTRRAAKRVLISQGSVSISSTNTFVSADGLTLQSPAAPNASDTAAVSNVNIPDAQDPELSSEQVSLVSNLESTLQSFFNPSVDTKAPTFEFAGIDILSLKVKGAYRGVSNFSRLQASEIYRVTGVIVGGANDGMEVSGTLKVTLAARRSTSKN